MLATNAKCTEGDPREKVNIGGVYSISHWEKKKSSYEKVHMNTCLIWMVTRTDDRYSLSIVLTHPPESPCTHFTSIVNYPTPSLRTQVLTPVNAELVELPASCIAIRKQQHLAYATVKWSEVKWSEVRTGIRNNFPGHSARSLLKSPGAFFLNILPLPPKQVQ